MSDRQEAQQQRSQDLTVADTAESVQADAEAQPVEQPLLGVVFGNVVLTDVGAEITLVVPREVVFRDEGEAADPA